ncbi:hypothetical protein GGTG_12481 [Gaeumannomyces tritici R3-111a-1]|uniref:C2H2-type domain-containing protein n=1 Tax=Gaeumannomyces tritici (strain R3-111a-1) TaxID=644352 RepID=J3PG55_GAET3|nr:hypothetical protein GGTG_12481 [Gaeumannomyces tritici R3-111a-1]EJT70309.1 hypothetical protein GGTG_12481 [Gaeumannomyces tritici R3-111a-1]
MGTMFQNGANTSVRVQHAAKKNKKKVARQRDLGESMVVGLSHVAARGEPCICFAAVALVLLASALVCFVQSHVSLIAHLWRALQLLAPGPTECGGLARTSPKARKNRHEPFASENSKHASNNGRQRATDDKGKGRRGKGSGKRRTNNDESSCSDDGGGGSLRCGPPRDKGAERKFACPLYRYDPIVHLECLAFKMTEPWVVRQHLARRHNADQRCTICGEYFATSAKCEAHLLTHREEESAQQTPTNREYHDLDRNQYAALGGFEAATHGMNQHDKWGWLWRKSCPEPDKPPHPGVFLDTLLKETIDVVLEASDRGVRQLPQLFRDHGITAEHHFPLVQDVHNTLFGARRGDEAGDGSMSISGRSRRLPQFLADRNIPDHGGALASGIEAVFFGGRPSRAASTLALSQHPPPPPPPPQPQPQQHHGWSELSFPRIGWGSLPYQNFLVLSQSSSHDQIQPPQFVDQSLAAPFSSNPNPSLAAVDPPSPSLVFGDNYVEGAYGADTYFPRADQTNATPLPMDNFDFSASPVHDVSMDDTNPPTKPASAMQTALVDCVEEPSSAVP